MEEESFYKQVKDKTMEYLTDPIKMGILAIIILAIIFGSVGYGIGKANC